MRGRVPLCGVRREVVLHEPGHELVQATGLGCQRGGTFADAAVNLGPMMAGRLVDASSENKDGMTIPVVLPPPLGPISP